MSKKKVLQKPTMQCFDIGNAVLWAYAKYRKSEMREEEGNLGKFGGEGRNFVLKIEKVFK